MASHSYGAAARSMLLGMTNGYGRPNVSAAVARMPGVTKCINHYLQGCIQRGQAPECFEWTSTQLNRFRADVHCDTGNEPGSRAVAVAFGEYAGGELCVWPRGATISDARTGRSRVVFAADTSDTPLVFDPFAPHAPAQWAGDRCSVIFDTVRGSAAATSVVVAALREMGFPARGQHSAIADEGNMRVQCTHVSRMDPLRHTDAQAGVQQTHGHHEGKRMVKIIFHPHGDGCRVGQVSSDEAICLGMLFQAVMGEAIKDDAWRNLRFRIGGMALTAEAAFTATEDTDVVVCSVLRGGRP